MVDRRSYTESKSNERTKVRTIERVNERTNERGWKVVEKFQSFVLTRLIDSEERANGGAVLIRSDGTFIRFDVRHALVQI